MTARQVRYGATRLTSTTRRQTSGASSQSGALPRVMPALLTRMSILPRSRRSAATARDRGGVGDVDNGGAKAATATATIVPFAPCFAPSLALQCRAGFVECRRVDVPQHRRAGSEHALGNGEADAARAGGHDRGTVFQIDGIHQAKALGSSLRGAK